MTVIYKIELTAQFNDSEMMTEVAEKSVLDPKKKEAWMHKVSEGLAPYIPDANIVCTDIKVFPGA